ncbi:MAG: quinone-dependent dihydroorotate dehydrogenase [Tenuifilaceae bacterium]
MYKSIIRPILFLLQPETVHHLIVALLRLLFYIPGVRWIFSKCFIINNSLLKKNVFGLTFNNPVGLAAGFDKNADFYNDFSSFGFSFIEIGTVTPKPQPGNPKPRSFRLKKDSALINRMGFNNKGVEHAVKMLKERNHRIIIGGNIGKNTSTSNESAINDYLFCFKEIYDHVDYITVNISCPNIANLRNLQDGEHLSQILETLSIERKQRKLYKPILLKVSPDLTIEQLDGTIQTAVDSGIDGFIATNTTTSRDNLTTPKSIVNQIGNGGLSGAPLKDRSTEMIRYIHTKTAGSKPIIGVGGILTSQDAIEKLEAGASLIQVYTGFIYSGPAIVKSINKAILNKS